MTIVADPTTAAGAVALVVDPDGGLLPDPHSGLPVEYLGDQAELQAFVSGREAGWLGEPELDEGPRDAQLGELPSHVIVAWFQGHAAGRLLREAERMP